MDPPRGQFSSHLLTMGKTYKTFLLYSQKLGALELLYFCVEMVSNPLNKSCHTWDPYRPCHRAGVISSRTVKTIVYSYPLYSYPWGPYMPRHAPGQGHQRPCKLKCLDQVSVYRTIGPLVINSRAGNSRLSQRYSLVKIQTQHL